MTPSRVSSPNSNKNFGGSRSTTNLPSIAINSPVSSG
jgi:hypothetical protein